MKYILRSSLALMLLIACSNVGAALIYDANATSSFSLIDSGGLFITATGSIEPPIVATSGTGTVSIDADTKSDPTLFPGTPLSISSEVSGTVTAPSGSSAGTVLNGFLITLDNVDDFAKTAIFDFTYMWDVSLTQAPASEAELEAGVASAFFHLTGFAPSGAETLAIDEGLGGGIVDVFDWLVHPMITFDFADIVTPAALTGTTSVTAYVTVPAMSIDSFSVITDATGGAARISEPVLSAWLLAVFIYGVSRFKKQVNQQD